MSSKARRGKGSGGGPSREVTISKAVSWILRHGAEKEGLILNKEGYANVAELLTWKKLKSQKVTFEELKQVVADNDKQRFSLVPVPSSSSTDPASSLGTAVDRSTITHSPPPPPSNIELSSVDPSKYLIRANQGHSLSVDSASLLTPIILTPQGTLTTGTDDHVIPVIAAHGTFYAAWPLILESGGLNRMRRTHIHLSPHPPGADSSPSSEVLEGDQETPTTIVPTPSQSSPSPSTAPGKQRVISGMRHDAQILITVNIRRSITEGGLKWWRSANEVLLTEGDEQGMLGLDFVERVVGRKEGDGVGVLWEGGKVVGELPPKLVGRGMPRGKIRDARGAMGGRGDAKGGRGKGDDRRAAGKEMREGWRDDAGGAAT
ncbi:MAG: hypothetical protein M1827_006817 [Pycnora praestabilis]|nr:MAG: hypothetical protein M1827_006817 [Pycnora praestabilis]